MFKSINGGLLPQRATRYSAGFDVYSNEDVVIGAGETKLIGLGIALDEVLISNELNGSTPMRYEMWAGLHYLALHIRSSLRAKGLTSLGTGIIDIDYRDEIKMVIHNPIYSLFEGGVLHIISSKDERYKYHIKKGDKIGQLILCRHEGWLLPSEYTKDEERIGGFCSSGER